MSKFPCGGKHLFWKVEGTNSRWPDTCFVFIAFFFLKYISRKKKASNQWSGFNPLERKGWSIVWPEGQEPTLSSIARTLRFRFKGYIPKLEERLLEEWGTPGTGGRVLATIQLGFEIFMVLLESISSISSINQPINRSIQFDSIQFNATQFNSIHSFIQSIQSINSIRFNSIQFNSIQFVYSIQSISSIPLNSIRFN